jgi:hypothetical protein
VNIQDGNLSTDDDKPNSIRKRRIEMNDIGKIECIKLVRNITHMGLVDSKNLVEDFQALYDTYEICDHNQLQLLVRFVMAVKDNTIEKVGGVYGYTTFRKITSEDTVFQKPIYQS